MSDPFLDKAASIEDSAPRELFEIVQNNITTYRIASGSRDITYGGNVYTASPLARTEVGSDTVINQNQPTIALPLTHPLIQRYMSGAVPPRQVVITVYQQQGAFTERIYGGVVVSVAVEKHVAKLSIQSKLSRILQRKLPVLRASRACPHILYDANCRADRNAFTMGVAGSEVPFLHVVAFDGRKVILNSMGTKPDQWAQGGELVHVPTGERMTILDQTGATIIMQAAIFEMANLDAVTVAAGCNHSIVTCRDKFANRLNFGGFPELPEKNPFLPTGLGVVEQE